MRVAFLSLPVDFSGEYDFQSMNFAPNAAMYLLSSILMDAGVDVRVIDPTTVTADLKTQSLREVLTSRLKGCRVVCISSNTLTWPSTIIAIKHIRSVFRGDVKIVLGGLHPTYCYEYIMSSYDIDFILRGEAEATLIELIEAIISGSSFDKIRGLVMRGKDLALSNELPVMGSDVFHGLPLPAYNKLPDLVYRALPIETSRGCRFNCIFCSIPHRNNWRSFNICDAVSRGVNTIAKYIHKFKMRHIFMTDDCFTSDFARAVYILEQIYEKHPDISITIETRVSDWTAAGESISLAVLQRNDIRLAFGVESGYNEGLKRISKGLMIENVEKVLSILEANYLTRKSYFSFIIGFPWERVDDCIRTISFAAALEKRYGPGIVNLNWLMMLPSRIWEKRDCYGIKCDDSIFDNNVFEIDTHSNGFHPFINRSERNYINHIIMRYEDKGIFLRNP